MEQDMDLDIDLDKERYSLAKETLLHAYKIVLNRVETNTNIDEDEKRSKIRYYKYNQGHIRKVATMT